MHRLTHQTPNPHVPWWGVAEPEDLFGAIVGGLIIAVVFGFSFGTLIGLLISSLSGAGNWVYTASISGVGLAGLIVYFIAAYVGPHKLWPPTFHASPDHALLYNEYLGYPRDKQSVLQSSYVAAMSAPAPTRLQDPFWRARHLFDEVAQAYDAKERMLAESYLDPRLEDARRTLEALQRDIQMLKPKREVS